jgi:hypothetical protein
MENPVRIPSYVTSILAVDAAIAAIAAPTAAADGSEQTCVNLSANSTKCSSPGHVEINDSPQYLPSYHWCPGEYWQQQWGYNWDFATCHDDHHRDSYGNEHSHDYWG